jgi:hypothetical protein
LSNPAENDGFGNPPRAIRNLLTLNDDFPSVQITTSLPFGSDELQELNVEIGLLDAFGALDYHVTSYGSYYTLDGFSHATVGEPIQPHFFASLPGDAGPLRGAVLTFANYQDQLDFDPLIVAPINETYTPTIEPDFDWAGWYPPVPFTVRRSNLTLDADSTLITLLGQYDPRNDAQRLFDHLEMDLYYSLGGDQEPAAINAIQGVLDPGTNQASFKVEATDSSGIHRVLIAHTAGDGTWQSLDLSHNLLTDKWMASVTATLTTSFYVQVVDGVGNVTIEANKGAYFALGRGSGFEMFGTYLPLILK